MQLLIIRLSLRRFITILQRFHKLLIYFNYLLKMLRLILIFNYGIAHQTVFRFQELLIHYRYSKI